TFCVFFNDTALTEIYTLSLHDALPILRLHSLYEIRIELNQLDLPKSHASFRTRANMMQLLNELEKYLEVKSQFGSLKLHKNKKRSEEHTSELQSRFDLVCRLLLEKKKH